MEGVVAVIKSSMNGIAACKKIGVDADLLVWLQANGAIKLTAEEFQFTAMGAKGTPVVPVTVNMLLQLAAGQLGAYDLHALKQKVTAAISGLKFEVAQGHAEFNNGPSVSDLLDADDYKPLGAAPAPNTTLGKLPAKKPSGPAAPVEAFPAFPVDQMKIAPPVQLRNAAMMYQPVKGSSTSSDRYFVVAANQELRIAARLSSGTLSVRIEGPAWEKQKPKIASAGFTTIDVVKGYASLHLKVGSDPVLAGKTLGAVIMGLGLELQTPFPNLKLIAG